MNIMEAKAMAGANAMMDIYEKSFNVKLTPEQRKETEQEWIEQMKPFQKWIENVGKTK